MNPATFFAPSLEEFYLKICKQQYNINSEHSEDMYDITPVFSGAIKRMTQLNVLSLEDENHKLVVNECEVAPLAYKKLFLKNVEFRGDTGKQILDRLTD